MRPCNAMYHMLMFFAGIRTVYPQLIYYCIGHRLYQGIIYYTFTHIFTHYLYTDKPFCLSMLRGGTKISEALLRILRVSGVVGIGIPTSTSSALDICSCFVLELVASSDLCWNSAVRHCCQPVCYCFLTIVKCISACAPHVTASWPNSSAQ